MFAEEIQEAQPSPQHAINDIFHGLDDITNDVFYKTPPTLQGIKSYASEWISTTRCNVSIPETYIRETMEKTQDLVDQIECYLWNEVKKFLQKDDQTGPDNIVQLINSFTVGDIFNEVFNFDTQTASLYLQAGIKIPEPKEFYLDGKTTKKKRNRESFQYISILDILSLVMKNPDARDIVANEPSSPPGVYRSYKDGVLYKNKTYFAKFPTSLRLTLNADDIEIVNNLSPRSGKHKICHFYVKIQNFDYVKNSSYSTSFLVLSINSKVLKKYGYEKVISPLIEDLKQLESDGGVHVKDGDVIFVLRAVLCSFAGDTLAAHDIFGFMSPSANYFCRQCYIQRDDMKQGYFDSLFPLRTVESHARDVENALRLKEQKALMQMNEHKPGYRRREVR